MGEAVIKDLTPLFNAVDPVMCLSTQISLKDET